MSPKDLLASALRSTAIAAPQDGSESDGAPAARMEPLKGTALRRRRARIENLRAAVQFLSLGVIVWIGVEFVFWVHALEAGQIAGHRPPGVEGFLPISALISLRFLLVSGEFSRVHPAGLVILGLILANAILLQRSFCSWICPVGTISESLGSLSRKLFRRQVHLPRWADFPLRSLKYLLLAFFLYAVFVQMGPRDVVLFLHSPYNRVADIKMLHFFQGISPFALKTLGVLVGLSFLVPYFWCRYLCPYGALLAGLSLFSPLKIRRDPASCIDCGLCDKACPSRLRVASVKTVRSDECFGCLSCVASCPVPAALQMRTSSPWRRAVRPAAFAALVLVLFFGGIEVAKVTGYWRTEISDQEYLRRAGEIDSPKYHHARGRVPEYAPTD